MKNIILVGLMGAGKTTVGKFLSQKMNKEFLDTDNLIVKTENKSINEIFAQNGEIYFRELEKNVIKQVSELSNKIISIGGGAMENQENISNLKKNGILFYLKADINELEKRLKNATDRPLLKNTPIREKLIYLLDKREKNYMLAQKIINASKSVELISEEIIEYYEKCN